MSEWRAVREVLAARLGGAADLLATTPALRSLKLAAAGRRITLLVAPAAAAAARQVPEVDEVIAYDAPWLAAGCARRESEDWSLAQRLRRRRFDGAVVFTGVGESPLPAAFLCHLAGIPRRLARAAEEAHRLVTDRAPECPRIVTDVRRQLELVAHVGCPADDERVSLTVPEAARRGVANLLDDLALPRGKAWALIWAGGPPAGEIPDSVPVALGRLASGGVPVVFGGHPADELRSERIRRRMLAPSISLVGRLGFAELSALVERAPALIAEGAEAALVARALGTPVVRV